ncbi:hypothetical protein, partial [Nitratidesulfovibrio liaohensis]|uniref:hypothetical protein n=1 Tax=Nitratidesulfovibrio liaohensis TaxID=2604158 RepID=UPI001AAE868E
MPGMNGTGPVGRGTGTGRGMGRCGTARTRRGQTGGPTTDAASVEASALDELAANLGNVLDTARDVINALRPRNGGGGGAGNGRGYGRGRGVGFGRGRGRGRGPAMPP